MTKRILFILLAVVLALSVGLIGCVGQQEEEEEEEPELTLIFSDHNPPPAAPNPAIVAYGDYIEAHSDGKVAVEVYTNQTLYTDVELFPAVKAGACDAGSYVPEIGDGMYYFQVVNLPFMGFPSQRGCQDIIEDLCDEHPEIMEDFTSQGVTLSHLVVMPGYNLHFYAHDLVIDEPEDLDGYQINAMEGDLCLILETIPGLKSSPIDFPDLHTTFTAKMGDGFCQHNAFLVALGCMDYFYSHTYTNIHFAPIGILWNTESYEACLDLVGQDVMDAAAELYCDTFYPLDAATLLVFTDGVAARGDTVTQLTPAQLQAFQDLMVNWHNDWINGADDPELAQEIYDDCLAMIAAY